MPCLTLLCNEGNGRGEAAVHRHAEHGMCVVCAWCTQVGRKREAMGYVDATEFAAPPPDNGRGCTVIGVAGVGHIHLHRSC